MDFVFVAENVGSAAATCTLTDETEDGVERVNQGFDIDPTSSSQVVKTTIRPSRENEG